MQLSVIVPTFNERDNVGPLIQRLETVLEGIDWEVIFVDDDSPDGTADRVREVARTNRRVRCLQRLQRRGLSSACIEGMLSSSADFFAVIDGDMQHDETLLPQMLAILREGGTDVVVGSRYMQGGSVGEWDASRVRISRFASRLAHWVLPAGITDPMSGFFMLRRDAFAGAVRNLSGIGFKILVDLFASSPRPLTFQELPYEFRTRQMGESKLDSQVAVDFILLILSKKIGPLIPIRFVSFALVGASGVLVHLGVFFGAFQYVHLAFTQSNILAALSAMASNFTFNNLLTYRDRRLRGWRWLRGLVLFMLACSIGAVANVGVAHYLFQAENPWFPSVLAGIVVGTVWNYATTSLFVWRDSKKD